MGFSRQEYWSGLPFPSPGDLPGPWIRPGSPVLQADSLPSQPPGKPSANTRPSYKFMFSVAGKCKLLVQLPSCPCEKNFPMPPRAFPSVLSHTQSKSATTILSSLSGGWEYTGGTRSQRGGGGRGGVFPMWLSGKESTCQCRRLRFDPWVGKIRWRRK